MSSSRIERLIEVLHVGRGTTLASRNRLTGSALARVRARKRAQAGITTGRSTIARPAVSTRVAEVLEALHPDDLEVLVDKLGERG